MQEFSHKLALFSNKDLFLLKEGQHGLEKESLRVTPSKTIAKSPHPSFLGSPLTHPYYSTDFGEAQLELITPPFKGVDEALSHLESLHLFLHHHLNQELIWPFSTPCALPSLEEVELAKYGTTKEAYTKWLYRKGLSLRYGKAMQLLSGIHYSFSFSAPFWKAYHIKLKSNEKLEDFITAHYFHLIRNFLRYGWICSYLFGASPLVDLTYLQDNHPELKKYGQDTLYAPYGTSIRMSPIGYFSQIQSQNAVSFNSLHEYLGDLEYMLKTPHPSFQAIGEFQSQKRVQINTHILQIEAEHYSRIRPKPKQGTKGRPLYALKKGIGYVESRILDLDPFTPCGVNQRTLDFIHLFFIYCLFKESPPIEKEERKILFENQNQVALYGRQKNLKLIQGRTKQPILLKNWSLEILKDMEEIAELFDKDQQNGRYLETVSCQIEKVENPSLTPSALVLDHLNEKNKSYVEFAYERAKAHHKQYLSKPLSKSIEERFKREVKHSIDTLRKLEEKEEDFLAGYEDLEFSTQILLKEAIRQKIDFEILDRKANFMSLKQGSHQEYIKQATVTRLDPLISYHLMENKAVTKNLLAKAGLEVPFGKLYSHIKEGEEDYNEFKNIKIVVKPNLTNMGQGISFVEPHHPNDFSSALHIASKFKQQILVEEFFHGEEFRFLVMQGQVVAICKRMPAHVKGDGIQTIKKLILEKNKRNRERAHFQKPLKVLKKEEKYLQDQGYALEDVPKLGEIVFLLQNSNVSTGGESIDYTDEIPSFYKVVAIQAAKAVGAEICGVDMLIRELENSPSPKQYRIIELNFNPALYLHRAPAEGKKRYVEQEVLKALGFSGSWK